ncbi:MAG: DUF6754 domain-containing protein [bacterium]
MPVWLNGGNWNLALFLAILVAMILYGIRSARQGKLTELREIPGIAAIEEAVGRATEMGKPLFFIPGVRDLNDVQTVAGISILRSVAEMTARFRCELVVPTDRSLVLAAARETCREAYTAAGHPDAYRDEMVTYISDEQFAFAAKVDGMINRQQPAACLLMGSFFAESLLLAEAGRQAGAIQIAGTAGWHQLPFLVAACDHVLIGEELFAASAYLTQDPLLLGSLRGQDLGKYLAMALVLGGSFLVSVAALSDWTGFQVARDAVLRLLQTE